MKFKSDFKKKVEMCRNLDYTAIIRDIFIAIVAGLYYATGFMFPQLCIFGSTCMWHWESMLCVFEWVFAGFVLGIVLVGFLLIPLLSWTQGKKVSPSGCNSFPRKKKSIIAMVLTIFGAPILLGVVHLIGYIPAKYLFWKKTLTLTDYFTWKTGLSGLAVIAVVFSICGGLIWGCMWCKKHYTVNKDPTEYTEV